MTTTSLNGKSRINYYQYLLTHFKVKFMFGKNLILLNFFLVLAVIFNGCALLSKQVKLEDVPAAAQKVIQEHTLDGTDKKITREKEDGKHFYKVEYNKDGRKHELQVDDTGKILETEEILTMEDLPNVVKETVKKESAGAEIKELALETEGDETFYEVEFEKDGKEHEVKISKDGSVLKHEIE